MSNLLALFEKYLKPTDSMFSSKNQGLNMLAPAQGLAPYGLRHSGEGVKGLGFFGPLQAKDGQATEISSEDELGEFPLLVPTLTQEEINLLLSGAEPTDDIYRKAEEHAAKRRQQGLSPFAQPNELRQPTPSQLPVEFLFKDSIGDTTR